MKREWKPGDVAVLASGGERVMAARFANRSCDPAHDRDLHWHRTDGDWNHLDVAARPLVVIDPEDREQIERLAAALFETGWVSEKWDQLTPGAKSAWKSRAKTVLRDLLAPPRPPEPQGLGAVVEDAEGRRWVRDLQGMRAGAWLYSTVGKPPHRWNWADVAAVRVLSEGVTE